MGDVNSSMQISEIIQKIYQTINNTTENISNNETINRLKSEIIQNYVQNLTQRSINKRDTTTNLQNKISSAIKVNNENEIAVDSISITGNKGPVNIEQVNESSEKLASSLQEFAEDVYNAILEGTSNDNLQMNAELCQSDETFNQAAQEAISSVIADTSADAAQMDTQESEVQEEKAPALIDLSGLIPKFEANSNIQQTMQNLDIQTNINNFVKNISNISVLNDKSIVQQLNSSLNKLFETINETVSVVNKTTEAIASAEVNQSNKISGSSLNISGNKGKVNISQLNKSKSEAITSVFISSLTSSDLDSKTAAIMSDIMGITTDNSSKSASVIDQSIAAATGASVDSSATQTAQKKSTIIGVSSGIIGIVIIIIVVVFIYKKVMAKKKGSKPSKKSVKNKSKPIKKVAKPTAKPAAKPAAKK